jgi:hypothetical protein
VLQWQQQQFAQTLPLSKDSANVGVLYTAPGYQNFSAFCAACNLGDERLAFSTVISDDEASNVSDNDKESVASDQPILDWPSRNGPQYSDFDLDGADHGKCRISNNSPK